MESNTSDRILYTITGGPSKDDLKLALFNQSKLKDPRIDFTVSGARLPVLISSVEREDGSDESWNIKGDTGNNTPVNIYYSTKSRSGKCRRA